MLLRQLEHKDWIIETRPEAVFTYRQYCEGRHSVVSTAFEFDHMITSLTPCEALISDAGRMELHIRQ